MPFSLLESRNQPVSKKKREVTLRMLAFGVIVHGLSLLVMSARPLFFDNKMYVLNVLVCSRNHPKDREEHWADHNKLNTYSTCHSTCSL